MSIESEILRIQHNIANAYAKVAEKGGEVPLQPVSVNLAAAVESIPQTLPAPDNNPIGTIISFMGTSAPKDYLVCDGAQHSISQYPALASFFAEQFGAKNHFGGDGTTTFAVPDMRNLFLRGYHGEAEEQLSGEIGQKQEATWIPHIFSGDSLAGTLDSQHPQNVDSVSGETRNYGYANGKATALNAIYTKFSARPVNMSVLYCIKAVASSGSGGESSGEVYSTE